jgi:hypothetical protein
MNDWVASLLDIASKGQTGISLDGYLVCDRINHEVFLADADKLDEALSEYTRLQWKRPIGFCCFKMVQAYEGLTKAIGPQLGAGAFSAAKVVEVSGLHRQKIQKWIDDGLVRASIPEASGRGAGEKEPRFAWWDLYVAATLGTLDRAGCRIECLKKASEVLYEGSRAFRKEDRRARRRAKKAEAKTK